MIAATVQCSLSVQVISPQRIPATIAPNLLLSPSMFTQTQPSSGMSAVGQESSHTPSTVPRPPLQEEVRILSRSQLQATLLHLIQVIIPESLWSIMASQRSLSSCCAHVVAKSVQLFCLQREKQRISKNKHTHLRILYEVACLCVSDRQLIPGLHL